MILYADPLLHAGFNNKASGNTLLIIIILSGAVLILLIMLTLCAIKRMCVTKKTSESVEEPKEEPIYDDIKPYFEEIQVEGNDAYGHVKQCHASKNCQNM